MTKRVTNLPVQARAQLKLGPHFFRNFWGYY